MSHKIQNHELPAQAPDATVDRPLSPDSSLAEKPSTLDITGAYHPAPSTEPNSSDPAAEWPEVAGYQITHELARGGMGRILAGTELALAREVAIKVLLPKANPQRFLTESRITARLPHPNIPPVYALGSLGDGSPYLVMKLIRGVTLQEKLRSRTDLAADLPQCIQIFEQICQAVGFAHVQGIIHRDLKPANVMLGAFGEVQVMDWGLAKDANATTDDDELSIGSEGDSSELTAAGTVLGTPAYMAPEQARGELVDARADVFALGGILTAILTGKPVFSGKSSLETIQTAARGDVQEVQARLEQSPADAELIAIAVRCLSPDKELRPKNGQEVATAVSLYRQSVERRLREAEHQRTASIIQYEAERKRRRTLLAAGGVIAAILVMGVIGTAAGLFRAREKTTLAEAETRAKNDALIAEQLERDRSEKRLVQLEKSVGVLGEIFQDLNPDTVESSGRPIHVILGDRLKAASAQIDGESVGDSQAVAKLQLQLAESLRQLGNHDEAIEISKKAVNTLSIYVNPDDIEYLSARLTHAACLDSGGRSKESLEISEDLFEQYTRLHEPNQLIVFQIMNTMASSQTKLGNHAKAAQILEEIVMSSETLPEAQYQYHIRYRANLASLYGIMTRHRDAIPHYEQCLAFYIKHHGESHQTTLSTMNHLSTCYRYVGQNAKALEIQEKSFQICVGQLGIDHPTTMASRNHLAAIYRDNREYDKALSLFEENMNLRINKLGKKHHETLESMVNYSTLLTIMNHADRALPIYHEIDTVAMEMYGLTHHITMVNRNNLANIYVKQENYSQAQGLLQSNYEIQLDKYGENHLETLNTLRNLAIVCRKMGENEQSLTHLKKAYLLWSTHYGYKDLRTTKELTTLAETYAIAGMHDESCACLEHHLAQIHKEMPKQTPELGGVLATFSLYVLGIKNYVFAEQVAREAVTLRDRIAPGVWSTYNTYSILGASLMGQNRYEEAEIWILSGYSGLVSTRATIPPGGAKYLPDALARILIFYTESDQPSTLKAWQNEAKQYNALAEYLKTVSP